MPPVATLPLALSITGWTIVGSLGTVVAVVVGAMSLSSERRRSKRDAADQVREQADQIRQQIQTFATAVHRVVMLLNDGSALISAASLTARALRAQAGEQPAADSLRRLIGDPPTAVTAAVEGWTSSSAAEELRAALTEMMTAGREIPGDVHLFLPIAQMLKKIADDGYSSTVFIKLLTDEPARMFVNAHGDDDLDDLTRSLATHLHGNAAQYFVVRYSGALAGFQSFVDVAAPGLIDLESSVLVRVARARQSTAHYKTYTDELRGGVARLRDLLPSETLDQLEVEIDVIQTAISKEAASEALDVAHADDPQ